MVRLYLVEALASIGGTFLSIGIFFYTAKKFGWGPAKNFTLAAVEGAVYVCGALMAGRLTARVPHRRVLRALYGLMALAAVIGGLAASGAAAVVAVAIVYTALAAVAWPILESLVARGVDSGTLARRVAVYNVVWPSVGAAAMAVEGSILDAWAAGVFFLAGAAHLGAFALIATGRRMREARVAPAASAPAPHLAPEPELLRVRTAALWISRLALPATYAVIYGLMPLMPELPAMRRFDTGVQTLVASTWMASRWLTFAVLAMTTWWHRRPRALLAAAGVMLVAFLGTTLPPSRLWGPDATPAVDLAALVLWQVVLGVTLGIIYSGSLYFGMVLSKGSTEHGGYHEALIGLGWALGPAAGAVAEIVRPGDATFGVLAVGAVIAAFVVAVAAASVLVRGNGASPAA